jgi:hypothetical protein
MSTLAIRAASHADTFSGIERLVLRRFHPRRIMIDLAVAPWIAYFVWERDWVRATAIAVIFGGLGLASVWRTDPDKLATTTLGKIALLHLHPMNLALQTLSLFPILYGLWLHEGELILLGLSLLCAGHTFGWSKVDPRFTYSD